ncbi:isoprenoid synthase domain-containing protein [Mycena sanguinolenta]|nr:isoprenoid synthase domain-containing protein [Mycena sanguinolenta]
MSTSFDYPACIRSLLTEIGYRYEPFPLYDAEYWNTFHTWMFDTLGPTSTWSAEQLTELEHSSAGIIERVYPYASTEMKLLWAKLSAIGILIDDSIEDQDVNADIAQFSHKIYLGEDQEHAMLALYHDTIKEMSHMYGNDSVLRGFAIVPWLNHTDACLMEKDIFEAERELAKVGGMWLSPAGELTKKFPHYMRSKSGIAEAYVAGTFKATKEQYIPLTRYIKAVPDFSFYIEGINDLLSFYKESMDGETYNFIQLRTRSLAATGVRGSGPSGEWVCHDTVRLLCDEIAAATKRIDQLLRLDECERKMRGDTQVNGIDDTDIDIAKQWRGWRDGYISWHFECRRYKLGALKPVVIGQTPQPTA